MHTTPLGERLPYNDYTTIDWLHDLVKDGVRHRRRRFLVATDTRATTSSARGGMSSSGGGGGGILTSKGLRVRLWEWWDAAQGWVTAALIGIITACIAFVVDVSVVTVADWKEGYCARGIWLHRGECCVSVSPRDVVDDVVTSCEDWRSWGSDDDETISYAQSYAMYVAFAMLFGLIAGVVTMTTRAHLPAVANPSDGGTEPETTYTETAVGKMMHHGCREWNPRDQNHPVGICDP